MEKINYQDFKDKLVNELSGVLPSDFKHIAHLRQFRSYHQNGFNDIIYSTTEYPDDIMLELFIATRNNNVENLVAPFINTLPGYREDSNTITVSIHHLIDNWPKRFFLNDADSFKRVLTDLNKFINGDGIELWEEWKSIKNIEFFLNESPTEPISHLSNQHLRCFRGLACAHMTQQNDFNLIFKLYRELLYEMKAPSYVHKQFSKMFNRLKYLGLN